MTKQRSIDSGELAKSIVSGIIVSVSVALVLGAYEVALSAYERRTQILYVSEMVHSGIERMRSAKDDSERLLRYNMLLRGALNFIDSPIASSKITYTEKEALRTVLPYDTAGRVTFFVNALALPEDRDGFFRAAAEQFEGVLWLRLETP